MGWCDSPAYFCAASEMAHNVAETLAATPMGSLDMHPLESFLIPLEEWLEATLEGNSENFTHLLEVYIDDFIQLLQTTNPNQLAHLSPALLHAIHTMFLPHEVMGHAGEDPASLKKLQQGDGTQKEILGWVFDGARHCIELPEAKVEQLTMELHQVG